MKRLSFNEHSKAQMLAGNKSMTHRWKKIHGIEVGDVCACVTGQDGKPAFLTPASEGFMTVRITNVQEVLFRDLKEMDACLSGFMSYEGIPALALARDFYRANAPKGTDFDHGTIWRYEWEVVK